MRLFVKIFLPVVLISMLLGCNSKSDKDYYDSALKKLEEGKTVEAVKDFEGLLKEFPKSELTRLALYKMGSLYQGNLVAGVNPPESMKKAVEFYQKVYKQDPSKPEAPNALFMSAFIMANEIKDFTAAEKTYRLFLDKYPSHDLASSARAELNYLGKSPEEILKENVATEEIKK
ncbi:MAG: tetratricopeptide repeat protein [bacterium]